MGKRASLARGSVPPPPGRVRGLTFHSEVPGGPALAWRLQQETPFALQALEPQSRRQCGWWCWAGRQAAAAGFSVNVFGSCTFPGSRAAVSQEAGRSVCGLAFDRWKLSVWLFLLGWILRPYPTYHPLLCSLLHPFRCSAVRW